MALLMMAIAVIAAIRFGYWPLTSFFGFIAGVYGYAAFKTKN